LAISSIAALAIFLGLRGNQLTFLHLYQLEFQRVATGIEDESDMHESLDARTP